MLMTRDNYSFDQRDGSQPSTKMNNITLPNNTFWKDPESPLKRMATTLDSQHSVLQLSKKKEPKVKQSEQLNKAQLNRKYMVARHK